MKTFRSGLIYEVSENELDQKQTEKITKFRDNNSFLKVSVVKIRNLKTADKSGEFRLKLPGETQSFPVSRTKLEVLSETDFQYTGVFDNGSSQIYMNSTKDGIFGRISTKAGIFLIEDIGNGYSVLLEVNKEKIISGECGSVHVESEKPRVKDKVSTRSVCGLAIRVGVMYTQAAENTSLNMLNVALTGVNDLNDLLANSGFTEGAFTLAGVPQEVSSFVEDDDACEDAETLRTYTEIQDFRNEVFADVVIVLTDGDYALGGCVDIIGPSLFRAFGVVEADVANAVYTFSHEVIHMIGGRHQQCDIFNTGGCDPTAGFAHGWAYEEGIWPFKVEKTTIMHELRSGWDRQLLLSNPDIHGRTDLNDNAQEVFNNFCDVSEFRDEPMLTVISGPSDLEAYQNGTWCVSVSNCTSVSSITWEVSYDGWNYFTFSTSSCLTYTIFNHPMMYIRNTVNCSDGQSAMRIYYVTLIPSYIVSKNPKVDVNKDFLSSSELKTFPNPATNILNLEIDALSGQNWSVNLTDLFGKKYNLGNVVSNTDGLNRFTFDLPFTVLNGVYLISMSNGSKYSINKILILNE